MTNDLNESNNLNNKSLLQQKMLIATQTDTVQTFNEWTISFPRPKIL